MTDTVYRFLPWARRGLAAAIPAVSDGAPVPARATVAVEVVVGGAGSVPTSTSLNGPGDVIGLDPTVIVRTIPRADSSNVEPNYLAAVDFDQPELPWLFTPTGVPAPSGHLQPWLVLVVVRERDGVSLTVPAGATLPVLSIDDDAEDELPDLADSWAWAHVQLLDSDGGSSADAVGQALQQHPDRNVSRLVCPRRLEPDARWIACLVPAFDAGVIRGFGGTPTPTTLKPAWTAPSSVKLPVYFHWRFQTGPQGDFESLARRLTPYEASARIGRVKMHVGDASPFVDLPAGDPDRFLDMDGALQAPALARAAAEPAVADATLADVPSALATGLREVTKLLADAADGTLDNQADPTAGPALGPPVYAGAYQRRTFVSDTDPTWFRELNIDPRARVAAGLGAEVVRRYQEDVMEACWQQVGDVLAVEAALSRARLSLEVALRFNARHLVPLSPGRFLQVTAPLAERTLVGDQTLPRVIGPTSFPDAVTDAAMRRYTSATGRVLSGVARRSGKATVATAARRAGEVLVSSLATGRADVDATRFPVLAVDGLPSSLPPARGDGTVALEKFHVGVVIDRASAAALTRSSKALTSAPEVAPADLMKPRPDLQQTGMVTSVHVRVARDAAVEQVTARDELLRDGATPALSDLLTASSSSVLDAVLKVAQQRSGELGFLIATGRDLDVHALGLRRGGELVVLTGAGRDNVAVATLDPRLRGNAREIGDLLGGLPNGSLTVPAVGRSAARSRGRVAVPTVLEPGVRAGTVVVRGGQVRGRGRPVDARRPGVTITMPPLVKDAATIRRYRTAVAELVTRTPVADAPLVPRLVAFQLDRAVTATRRRSDPLRVHPARLDTMVSLAGHGLASILAEPALVPAWRLPQRFDRVMAFPRLDLPAYAYLAAYDRTRFCPGVDEVPPDSITLLETNPRFVAAFMAGLNHETNRELLWRSYPTDGRGTPWQRFWQRPDDRPDIRKIHTWGDQGGGRDGLPWQTSDPTGNLVLLLRGDLLRRYPRTMAVAVKAVTVSGRQQPSDQPGDLRTSVFAGTFEPDVSFFGFPLVSADLSTEPGWFFGLMEPVTEPRFGFDETVDRETERPTSWNDVAWPDLHVEPAAILRPADLAGLGLTPAANQADGVAAALFQRPFKLLVHARHLVKGI